MSRPGRRIDYKQWAGIPSIALELAVDSTQLGGALHFTAPATILRCRGEVLASFDETKQAGDRMKVSVALGIIPSDTYTLGLTAVPDPGSEPEYSWLYWNEFWLEAYEAAAEEAEGASVHRLSVDTKAMRKVRPGEALCWIVQFSNASGAPVTNVQTAGTRVLYGT